MPKKLSDKDLAALKDRLLRLFVGKGPVHALGMNRPNGSIRVYVRPGQSDEALFARIRKAAEPAPVEFIEAESGHR